LRVSRSAICSAFVPSRDAQGLSWWTRAAVGIVLGAATHLVWDGFTHGGYWGADLIPALRAPTPLLGVPWFNVLQHVSTIAGGLVVLVWGAREARQSGGLGVLARSAWRWLVILAVASVALAGGLWNGARLSAESGYWAVQLWLGRVAVAALLVFGLALLAYSVAHHLVRRTGHAPAT
jgi:hypothetical protein